MDLVNLHKYLLEECKGGATRLFAAISSEQTVESGHLTLLNCVRLPETNFSSLLRSLDGISFPPACWLHHTACCQQICWGYACFHCSCCWQRCWTGLVPILRNTAFHLDIDSLTTFLGVQPSGQFLTHQVVHVSNLCLQFRDKDIMWDSIQCFAQVQMGDVCGSSLVHCGLAPLRLTNLSGTIYLWGSYVVWRQSPPYSPCALTSFPRGSVTWFCQSLRWDRPVVPASYFPL